jgi:ABC-type microcin C transport system duplicated ATPase subunit YejF
LVFQEPSIALNPVLAVIDQLIAVLKAHERLSATELRSRAQSALAQVGFPKGHASFFSVPQKR